MARTPHVLLVSLAAFSLVAEVTLFTAMGERWPALGPGPLPAWFAVAVTAGSNLVWSYVYWRGLEWRGRRPLLRAMIYTAAITVVAFPLAGLVLLARWDDVVLATMIAATLPPALLKAAVIVWRRRRDALERDRPRTF